MLKIQYADKRKAAIWLVNPEFSIGSGIDNDMVITEGSIATRHISFAVNDDSLMVSGITGDAAVNGNALAVGQKLVDGDLLAVGGIELEILNPANQSVTQDAKPGETPASVEAPSPDQWRLSTVGDWLGGKAWPLDGPTLLGREPGCDITIPGKHLSRKHASLQVEGNQVIVKDLGSINGTFVNGERVQEATLNAGDHIRFDVLEFKVEGPEAVQDPNQTMVRPALNVSESPDEPVAPIQDKRWKTGPTSHGNRSKTEHMPAIKESKTGLLATSIVAAVAVGLFFLL